MVTVFQGALNSGETSGAGDFLDEGILSANLRILYRIFLSAAEKLKYHIVMQDARTHSTVETVIIPN